MLLFINILLQDIFITPVPAQNLGAPFSSLPCLFVQCALLICAMCLFCAFSYVTQVYLFAMFFLRVRLQAILAIFFLILHSLIYSVGAILF